MNASTPGGRVPPFAGDETHHHSGERRVDGVPEDAQHATDSEEERPALDAEVLDLARVIEDVLGEGEPTADQAP